MTSLKIYCPVHLLSSGIIKALSFTSFQLSIPASRCVWKFIIKHNMVLLVKNTGSVSTQSSLNNKKIISQNTSIANSFRYAAFIKNLHWSSLTIEWVNTKHADPVLWQNFVSSISEWNLQERQLSVTYLSPLLLNKSKELWL